MESSILASQFTLHNVECLIHCKLSRGLLWWWESMQTLRITCPKETRVDVVDGRASRDAACHAGGSGFSSRSRPDLRLVWKSCTFV
jgi:hypothetical protein